jgi:hypothetical protein
MDNTNPLPELFATFRSEAFRIESLPLYTIEDNGEFAQFQRYQSGGLLPDIKINEDWYRSLDEWASQGKQLFRVRVLPNDSAQYVWFEIDWFYPYNVLHGERLFFILESDFRKHFNELLHDFWMFDREHVGVMNYSDEGRFLGGAGPSLPLEKYVDLRNRILDMAMPFEDFMIRARRGRAPFKEMLR